MHQAIEDMVADERAGGVGHARGEAHATQVGDDGFDGERRPIADRTAANHRAVDGVASGVVGDTGIGPVDGDAFGGDIGTVFGEAEAEDEAGFMLVEECLELVDGFGELAGQSGSDYLVVGDRLIVELMSDEFGRVGGVITERFESG